jgi:hypothetical protein
VTLSLFSGIFNWIYFEAKNAFFPKGSRQNKKTLKLGNFSQPPMTPPPPSKLGKKHLVGNYM